MKACRAAGAPFRKSVYVTNVLAQLPLHAVWYQDRMSPTLTGCALSFVSARKNVSQAISLAASVGAWLRVMLTAPQATFRCWYALEQSMLIGGSTGSGTISGAPTCL